MTFNSENMDRREEMGLPLVLRQDLTVLMSFSVSIYGLQTLEERAVYS